MGLAIFTTSNVYALIFDLFDNKRNFNFKSNIFSSYTPRFSETKGFRGQVQLSELRGKFRYTLGWTGVDKYYNQNELGFYNYSLKPLIKRHSVHNEMNE